MRRLPLSRWRAGRRRGVGQTGHCRLCRRLLRWPLTGGSAGSRLREAQAGERRLRRCVLQRCRSLRLNQRRSAAPQPQRQLSRLCPRRAGGYAPPEASAGRLEGCLSQPIVGFPDVGDMGRRQQLGKALPAPANVCPSNGGDGGGPPGGRPEVGRKSAPGASSRSFHRALSAAVANSTGVRERHFVAVDIPDLCVD